MVRKNIKRELRHAPQTIEAMAEAFPVGMRVGKLTLTSAPQPYIVGSRELKRWYVSAECDCGNKIDILDTWNIRNKRLLSCGCVRKTINKTKIPNGTTIGLLRYNNPETSEAGTIIEHSSNGRWTYHRRLLRLECIACGSTKISRATRWYSGRVRTCGSAHCKQVCRDLGLNGTEKEVRVERESKRARWMPKELKTTQRVLVTNK